MKHTIQDYVMILGRLFIVILFIYAGIGKIMDPEGTIAYITSSGLPFPTLAYLGSIIIEVILAFALLFGLMTRITATIIAIFTLITSVVFHIDFSDSIQVLMFLKNIAIFGGLLQIIAIGGGQLSIDAMINRKKINQIKLI
ncbi:DoxX family protein [Neisseria sp. Ec49-e6-T10]|uniref:DoxX family protein n=1 Tax=Neisseria sp. Ec49-e6-T10 TaxID=3140744 RepID=UPI003EB7670F